jgi:hypothetical protein
MSPVFYMAIGLDDFDGGKSITQAIARGPENLDFWGPNGTVFARCHFRAQKRLDFLMALVMDLPASKSLCPAQYKQ